MSKIGMIFIEDFSPTTLVKTKEGVGGQRYVPAILAVPGIQEYPGAKLGRPDLKKAKILITQESLVDPVFLESLKNAPVTMNHTGGMMNESNLRKYKKGHLSAEIAIVDFEGFKVPKADIYLDSDDLISNIDSGKMQAVSLGYFPDIIWESGVDPVFGAFDGYFCNRKGNHVTVCDRARIGSRATLVQDNQEEYLNPEELKALMDQLAFIKGQLEGLNTKVTAVLDSAEEATEIEIPVMDQAKFMSLYRERVSLESMCKRHKLNVLDSEDNEVVAKKLIPALKLPADSTANTVAIYCKGVLSVLDSKNTDGNTLKIEADNGNSTKKGFDMPEKKNTGVK